MCFLCPFLTSLKARERESTEFDENRNAVEMLSPMRDKNASKYRGGEGVTPVTRAPFAQHDSEGKTSDESI